MAPQRDSTRAAFADAPASDLGLVEPIKVERAGFTRGGHLYVFLEDAVGTTLNAWEDIPRRKRSPGLVLSPVYIGEQPPSKGAIELSDGAPEQAALYGILIRWVERHPLESKHAGKRLSMDERSAVFAHHFLGVLDWRFASVDTG